MFSVVGLLAKWSVFQSIRYFCKYVSMFKHLHCNCFGFLRILIKLQCIFIMYGQCTLTLAKTSKTATRPKFVISKNSNLVI